MRQFIVILLVAFAFNALGQSENALEYFKPRLSYHAEHSPKQIVEFETPLNKEQIIQLLEHDKKIQRYWINILTAVLILLVVFFIVIYFLLRIREQKNSQVLNLEIDNLAAQQKELSEKHKNILAAGKENSIDSHDQRLLKKAIEVVENNLNNPLFGVEQMAKEIGMSRTNLHRKIKATTGFPTSELIRSIRLRKAAALLLNKSYNVTQVGLQVGFEDHSYFSKSFKKQFGVPPSEYFRSRNQSIN